jgi:NAD-dependent dihydropyrimidine dehydrogenase PreA subunit
MVGLDELFDELYAEGMRPGVEGLRDTLVERAGEDNYIPPAAREEFATILESEYESYTAHREGGAPPRRTEYGTWRGYPREQIPWYPTVDEDLCDACGKCLRLCSSKALVADEEGKAVVADPFKCVVGCSSCASFCRQKAITFPPRSVLEMFPVRPPNT